MKSKFKCIECGAEYPLDEIRFKCDCGDLLEVISDLESFGRSGDDWRREFDSRSDLVAFARYKDLLLPDLPDDEVVTLLEGDTPLYHAGGRIREHIDIDSLYLKHEGMNPTLSFKDRGMVAGVSWAKHLGVRRVARGQPVHVGRQGGDGRHAGARLPKRPAPDALERPAPAL